MQGITLADQIDKSEASTGRKKGFNLKHSTRVLNTYDSERNLNHRGVYTRKPKLSESSLDPLQTSMLKYNMPLVISDNQIDEHIKSRNKQKSIWVQFKTEDSKKSKFRINKTRSKQNVANGLLPKSGFRKHSDDNTSSYLNETEINQEGNIVNVLPPSLNEENPALTNKGLKISTKNDLLSMLNDSDLSKDTNRGVIDTKPKLVKDLLSPQFKSIRSKLCHIILSRSI